MRLAIGALFFALTASAANAASGPRLGLFTGQQTVKSIVDGATMMEKTPLRPKFELRSDRNRLYISFTGEKGQLWRQSMVVVRDRRLADGTREIEYVRPPEATRSGRYNMARYTEFSGGGDIALKDMTGNGMVRVHTDGKLEWMNEGAGKLSVPPVVVDYNWVEGFDGQKAR